MRICLKTFHKNLPKLYRPDGMASQPTVGSKVLARGRSGDVVLHDADDPSMMYKAGMTVLCFSDLFPK